MKISASIITRGRPDKLQVLLESLEAAKLDEIIVVETNGGDPDVEMVCQAHGARYETYLDPNQAEFQAFCAEQKLGEPNHFSDFAAARNYAFSLCSGDWILWMDSDDVAVKASNLRDVVQQADKLKKLAVQAYYLYCKDEEGNVLTEQWRERIVKRGSGEWFPFLHELYINRVKPISPDDLLFVPKEVFHVEHSQIGLTSGAEVRNYRVLLYHLQKDKKLESRMWKMLGKAASGIERFHEAVLAYKNHMEDSSWDVDHFFSCGEIAQCYRSMGRPQEALIWDLKAIEKAPQYPQGWAGLAMTEADLRCFDKALFFSEIGISCLKSGQTTSMVEFNPAGTAKGLYFTQYQALRELGRHRDSLTPLSTLSEIFPEAKNYEELLKITNESLEQARLGESFGELVAQSINERDEAKFYAACDAAPKSIFDLAPYKHFKRVDPDRSKHSIAIVCANGGILFGPSSLSRGIGGSEEAVIHMAAALARQGFWVDVFANTLEEGEHDAGDGHKYRWYPTGAYLRDQVYDTVISWRRPSLFTRRVAAKNQIAWQHDVGRKDEWPDAAIENIDKVIVLSKFHRETLPWIPEEKIIYSANGLSADWFADLKNDHLKVIYPSNPTRGLKNLLKIWPDVNQATGAELHLFYGFTDWHRRIVANNPQEQKYMTEIGRMYDDARKFKVFDHGMVGQKELAEWTAKCGVSAYPTEFPEISCISMMRNQAMGAIPVVTDYAALSETVQFGSKIPWKEGDPYPLELFKEKLIYMLQNPGYQEKIRSEMVPWARQKFLWDDVARSWGEAFEAVMA